MTLRDWLLTIAACCAFLAVGVLIPARIVWGP